MARKKGAKQVPECPKKSILHISGAGMSHSAIARYFVMPRSTVSNIVNRSKQSFASQPKKRGRKLKLSERRLRKLMNYVKKIDSSH